MEVFYRTLLTLGASDVWGHKEFEAFKEGFNIEVDYEALRPRRLLTDVFPKEPRAVLALLAGLFKPRLVDANAIWRVLSFDMAGARRRIGREVVRDRFAQLLVRAVRGYLRGCGHPIHELLSAVNLVDAEQMEHEADSPLTRPLMFLRAFTDSAILPAKDSGEALRVSKFLLGYR